MDQNLDPELSQPLTTEAPDDAIDASLIDSTFSSTSTDLISASLSSRILSFSDEFFAPASNLTNPSPPISRPGVFVETGAWYDGWETRRHNRKGHDWVVIRLGVAAGRARGVEIDTAFFTGNYAPEISVDACFEPDEDGDQDIPGTTPTLSAVDARVASPDHTGWTELLPRRACGPGRRQAWLLSDEARSRVITHVRLKQYPDGGIARFRLYGGAVPVWPAASSSGGGGDGKPQEVELSAARMGGIAVACSDQHYGRKENLLLPGRGKDMGDGWETKRSRGEHVDWVVVKLGAPGRVSRVVVDTMHFRGNFPRAIRVDGAFVEGGGEDWRDARFVEIVPTDDKMGPDTEFEYKGERLRNVEGKAYTHLRLTMIPDGGVKRFRVFGTRALEP